MGVPLWDLPHVRHLAERHEGVAAVGVDPQVASGAAVHGHQFAIVDAGAVGQRQADAVALELFQMSAFLACHGGLRLHHCVPTCFGTRPQGFTERGRRDYDDCPKWATSLNERSMGPRSPTAIRVMEARPTNMRHATSSSVSRAHATAALIGDTWLTTTTTSPAASAVRSSHAALTRRPTSASDSPPGGV